LKPNRKTSNKTLNLHIPEEVFWANVRCFHRHKSFSHGARPLSVPAECVRGFHLENKNMMEREKAMPQFVPAEQEMRINLPLFYS
jgi:hypothetical protein